jgi:hypothetical protein
VSRCRIDATRHRAFRLYEDDYKSAAIHDANESLDLRRIVKVSARAESSGIWRPLREADSVVPLPNSLF